MKFYAEGWAIKLLYLFLVTDLSLIAINVAYLYSDSIINNALSIEVEGGYAETFGYLKEYWSALLLGFLAIKKRLFQYLSWSLLFFYLLLDDALQLHETLGMSLTSWFNFPNLFNLRARDLGELVVSAIVGLFFLILIGISYRFGDRVFRKASRYLMGLLLALATFGVGVDIIHAAVNVSLLHRFLGLVEDGGEMIVLSVIACFVFVLFDRLQSRTRELPRFNKIAQKPLERK